MDSILTTDVRDLIKQLILNISGFDESSEYYKTVEDFAFSHIASPNYFFTYNRNDIEKTISNLGEKFRFHGFVEQSNAIIGLTKKFFDASTSQDDREVRVSIMKFLLNISHSPTNKFIENPEAYKPQILEEKEITDWSSYLRDTKVQICQSFSDTSDDNWSQISTSSSESLIFDSEIKTDKINTVNYANESSEVSSSIDFHNEIKNAKEKLLKNIQTCWWNSENVLFVPPSNCDESKVAMEWDKFVSDQTMGLVNQKSNIIPEYKFMRELLWQFYIPHTSFAFDFDQGKVIPKSGITISSVRSHTFQYFLHEFVPHIEMMRVFRTFQESLLGEYFVASIPDSYRSYSEAVKEILEPVFEKLRHIEDRIRKQDEIITILSIASELRPVFKNLELLYWIQNEIMNDDYADNNFKHSTFLLSRLYYGLLNSSDLKEQNLYLTLYLKTLYKYFTIIEIWLTQDMLQDLSDEFIVIDKNSNSQLRNQDWQMEYVIRDLDSISQMDGMLNIISTKVLQLAKNIHFLHLLGKLHLITNETGSFKGGSKLKLIVNRDNETFILETLHEEFIRKVLEEAMSYNKQNFEIDKQMNIETKETSNKLPTVICPEINASKTGIDLTENFVDFSDGFLATVFENYLHKNVEIKFENKKINQSLFQTINKKIVNLFPSKQILEKVFMDVLDSRYKVPGLMVKNILINQFDLKKYFQLIKHLYLFEDDIIFPFYKTMFKQFESQQTWGNFYWLTSQLQDLLMDLYPDYYEFCRVDVEPDWRLCTNPIIACELVSLHCKINWPINIVIRTEHILKYHDVFQFILKLKWAMNTLNRLSFAVIEPKSKPFKMQTVLNKQRLRKLQIMRFFLLNDVSSMQHCVLGHLFSGLWKNFDKDLEHAYDLDSIIKAHDMFISRVHSYCVRLRDQMSNIYGFRKILTLVLQLHEMWNDLESIDDDLLDSCEIECRKCHKFLRPIIEIEVATF